MNPIISQLAQIKGCQFCNLTYKGKGKPGENPDKAKYTLLLGVNTRKAYSRDLALYKAKVSKLSGVDKIAAEELIASLSESLTVGIGNNSGYTNAETYVATGIDGVKVHKETGQLYVSGYVVKREIVEQGFYKPVKSSEKTIAKNKLRKLGKLGRFRQFALSPENLSRVALNGKVLEIA